jgi:hypothetical protein
MSIYCPDCEAREANLGQPSHARWVAPDGSGDYCSLHFIQRFGHGEKLVPVEGYEPPPEVKAPAPRQQPQPVQADEVGA